MQMRPFICIIQYLNYPPCRFAMAHWSRYRFMGIFFPSLWGLFSEQSSSFSCDSDPTSGSWNLSPSTFGLGANDNGGQREGSGEFAALRKGFFYGRRALQPQILEIMGMANCFCCPTKLNQPLLGIKAGAKSSRKAPRRKRRLSKRFSANFVFSKTHTTNGNHSTQAHSIPPRFTLNPRLFFKVLEGGCHGLFKPT